MAITLGPNAPHHQGFNLLTIVTAIVGSVLLAASIFLCYGFSDRLGGVLGQPGMTLIIQVTSFLLVCIGVQILWYGGRELLVSFALAGALSEATMDIVVGDSGASENHHPLRTQTPVRFPWHTPEAANSWLKF